VPYHLLKNCVTIDKKTTMAIKAESTGIDVICERCGSKKAEREYLILETEILYLCRDCAKHVVPFIPFLQNRKKTGED
jgi:ribosome-binding protein aMBF1 (putative translation factor)